MSSRLMTDLFALAFPEGLPGHLAQLIRMDDVERERLAFKAGPILTFDARPHRAYIANVAEEATFDARMASTLGRPDIATFFQQAPTARKMVDSDGEEAVLYLDDLHEADSELTAHDDHELMCATWNLSTDERTTLTRHGRPPRHLLPIPWQRRVDDLLHAGLVGLWAVRWNDASVRSLLWVNDTRWRGDPEQTSAVIDRTGDATWSAIRERTAAEGLLAYPDSIELLPDGRWDVTVGLLDPNAHPGA